MKETKTCKICEVSKSREFFHQGRRKCISCYNRKCVEYAHSETGKEKRKDYNKIWSKENAAKKNACSRKREISKIDAIPTWADLGKIENLYKLAKDLEVETGIKYDVDHIVPLRSELVCGLHVESNLRVITAVENRIKGNLVWPDCP